METLIEQVIAMAKEKYGTKHDPRDKWYIEFFTNRRVKGAECKKCKIFYYHSAQGLLDTTECFGWKIQVHKLLNEFSNSTYINS